MLRPFVMDFASWTERRIDTTRLQRLVVGWFVGGVTVVASTAFMVLTSKGVAAQLEDEEGPIEVELAREPEPEPPPPPPPPDTPKSAPRPRLVTPTTISEEKLEEKEPAPNLAADEKMEEEPEEAAPTVASAAPPPPPPPVVAAKPAVKKPIRLTEDMPKPVQLVMKTPEYPARAKSSGVEGVVIVRYVIAEDGSVRDVKALKGPPELQEACLEAVRSWRFQPVIVDGSPQAVVRVARFPFRLR